MSVFQYHSLCLTSAPEDDYLSVHIHLGDAATEGMFASLRATLQSLCTEDEPTFNKIIDDRLSSQFPAMVKFLLRHVSVQGPFGSVTDNILSSDVAVLVGVDGGILPFASILKNLWYHLNALHQRMRLKKVYFFWLRQDFAAVQWFTSLLLALEAQDLDSLIEIHTVCTHVIGEGR